MRTLPHTHSCFVCGESNAVGLNLRFHTDGQLVRGRFVPRAEHIGFKGVVHGGLITTVLDEIMVWACVVQAKRFAFCAELTVRFIQPVRPGQTLLLSAELAANRRDKIFDAKAEMSDDAGIVLATATGKYLPIKHADATEIATEFVEDPSWLFESR